VNPHGFKKKNTFELVLKYSQIPNLFSFYLKHQKSIFIANMPARQHFFRSLFSKLLLLRQAIIRNPESLPSTCRLGKLQRRANIHRYANFTR
jgi:hypothetical protein